MTENAQKQATTTLIRTIYSDGFSYVVIKFYNTNLAFQFVPFQRKDETGKNIYDQTKAQSTTITQDSAYALFKFGTDLLEGKIQEGQISVNGNQSTITIEKKFGPTGLETVLSITKNGQVIPFKFTTQTAVVKENGQSVQKFIDSGLGSFTKMLEGYLTGINSDRHLNKLTDDYVKSLEQTETPPQPKQNNYQKPYNNSQKKPWQQNNWKKPQQQPYNPTFTAPNSWETQQNLSSYKVQQ